MARLYPNEKSAPPRYDSPAPGVKGFCGESFASEVEVRVPYKGVDRYSNLLPAYPVEIFFGRKPDNMKDPLFQQQLEYALKIGTLNLIDDIIDSASDLKSAYAGDGLIDSANNSAIGKLIAEARDHMQKAKKLKSHWGKAWIANDLPRGWPLENQWFNDQCEDRFAPEKFQVLTMTPQGAKASELVCPDESFYRDHQADRLLYVDLVRGALLRARCAQEAAAAVGTYNRNKKEYQKAMKAKSLQAADFQEPPETTTPIDASKFGIGIVGPGAGDEPPFLGGVFDGGEEGEGGEESEEGVDEDEGLPEPDEPEDTDWPEPGTTAPSTSKKSKKKSGGSGLLIAGAAVLGLLAFGGKK